jgi:hypothetical protein
VLLDCGFKIKKAGTRRVKINIILTPLLVVGSLIKYKYVSSGIFWDLFGFADFVYAVKIRKVERELFKND